MNIHTGFIHWEIYSFYSVSPYPAFSPWNSARTDKIRRSYYQYYTDRKWGGVDGKTMAIDSSFYGVDGTVDLIVNMVHKKWPDFVSPEKTEE